MHPALLLVFLLCLAVSVLLSGMEAGVFALSRLRIRQLMRKGNPRARALYGYLENPERFLWTILVGNTLANLVVVSGGLLGLHYWLGRWPAAFLAALLIGGVLFYALCELLPKMLFRVHPNRLCLFLAPPFRLVDLALKPLVAGLAFCSRTLLRWSGGRQFTGRLFGSREELRRVMQESAQELTTEERAMINRVLDLQNLTVDRITVPLARVVMAPAETTMQDFFALCRERGFSRLPVCKQDGARRRIVGLVSLRPLLFERHLDLTRPIAERMRPALFLASELRLEVALRRMQRAGQRLAMVLGPDGSEIGIVSLHDILKVIFGEVSL